MKNAVSSSKADFSSPRRDDFWEKEKTNITSNHSDTFDPKAATEICSEDLIASLNAPTVLTWHPLCYGSNWPASFEIHNSQTSAN